MLDRRKKFEFSIESSFGQEQDWSTSQISDTKRVISELLEARKPVSTLRVHEKVSATRAMLVEDAEMDDKEAHRFRALTARLNYFAGDRPDLLFASKSICKNMARPRSEDWLALKRVGRYLKRSDENGAAIPLDGRRHPHSGLHRLRLGRRPSEHVVHKWWCDHAEWTLHKGLVDFAVCTGFELRRSRILRYDKSGSSAPWRNQHGQRLLRDLDRSCEIRLLQCNPNSSQRWCGRPVPTYQDAVFVDPVKDQGWRSQVTKGNLAEQRG